MCGIAGFIKNDKAPSSDSTAAMMRKAILYRGRDEQGEWTDNKNTHLFHSRLSIIDLSTGQQPMWDANKRYVVVFNGEIYNYKELREEYQKLGFQFKTQSDTEVLLAGFALKREKMCADLNGMFAFAIWDTKEKKLFMARDHLGKKPLFWCQFNNTFYFSSTIDAFLSIPGWNKKISAASVELFGLLGHFPENSTIYQDVFALPYASYCFVELKNLKPKPVRYWRMNFSPKNKLSLNENLEKYETILTNATEIRLRSDVPLALTFSGGVDSGTIAALCVKKFNRPVQTFTIDYHTKENPSQETQIAEQVAKSLGLKWDYIHFDYSKDIIADLPEAYQYYDQPCNQLPLVYSKRLYDAIKPKATVVVSGNGTDESFTGYIGDEKIRQKDVLLSFLSWTKPFAKLAYHLSPTTSLKSSLAYFGLSVPTAHRTRFLNRTGTIATSRTEKERLNSILETLTNEAQECNVSSLLDLRMFVDLTCSAVDSNYKLPDISGLGSQVEVRSPFLDHRLIQFSATLPHKFKIKKLFSAKQNKYLPKVYYEKYVPSDIAWSQKKGMGYNLRWDLSIRNDERFVAPFEEAYNRIDSAGLSTDFFRTCWKNFRNGQEEAAGSMMTGFMLGAWLKRTESYGQ